MVLVKVFWVKRQHDQGNSYEKEHLCKAYSFKSSVHEHQGENQPGITQEQQQRASHPTS